MFGWILFILMFGALAWLTWLTFVQEPFLAPLSKRKKAARALANEKFSRPLLPKSVAQKRPDDEFWEQIRRNEGFMRFDDARRIWKDEQANGYPETSFFTDGQANN